MGYAAEVYGRLQSERRVHKRLTGQQLTILRLVAQGNTTGEIASNLGVVQQTVKNHLTTSYLRLGVRNRAAAIAALDDRQPGWRNAA